MTKKAKKPRNYRATEATYINVGASKKRDTVQNARIAALEKGQSKLAKDVALLFDAMKIRPTFGQFLREMEREPVLPTAYQSTSAKRKAAKRR